MNYLAHILLSGDDKELRIGNFIADSVRGKNFDLFPNRVADGIILHRKIDTYTDTHSIVHESKDVIRPKYGLWSSVIMDMFYDHFLAANWAQFHDQPLREFAADFYKVLEEYFEILPARVQRFLPIMKEYDWLTSYATVEGMSTILYQMNKRTKGKSKMQFAVMDLELHYNQLQSQFFRFFEELQVYVASQKV
jgi:acyl carrier protein phosphodiesterase